MHPSIENTAHARHSETLYQDHIKCSAWSLYSNIFNASKKKQKSAYLWTRNSPFPIYLAQMEGQLALYILRETAKVGRWSAIHTLQQKPKTKLI